jgi:transcriptional regulator with XRE-family HTH domain
MIAEQLRVAVQEALWTRGIEQAELARSAEMSQAMMSRFVRGERFLSPEAIDKVLDVLGLEIVIRPRREREEGGRCPVS